MIAFPDTSFLCAIYRRQDNSPQAAAHFKGMKEVLHIATALHLKAEQFLTFDAKQRKLATAAGLKVKP